jgi:hypothetical protein
MPSPQLTARIKRTGQAKVNFVQVTPDNRRRRVWMVAAPRQDAVSLVLNVIPEGWTASLMPLRPVEASRLNMQPGDLRELT